MNLKITKILRSPTPTYGQRKVLILLVGLSILMLLLYNTSITSYYEFQFMPNLPPNHVYELDTPQCKILKLNPYDDKVKKYIKKMPRVICGYKPPLVRSNQTHLWVDEYTFNMYGEKSLSCCYQSFHRPKSKPGISSDFKVEYNQTCVKFREAIPIQDEFVRVTCTAYEKKLYFDFHSFPQHKPRKHSSEIQGPSVLILGVDSVSRANIFRQMPQTLKFLQSINAIDFTAFNKVGDNTYPNMLALLGGLSPDDLKKFGWKYGQIYDSIPLIWDKFANAGYLTGWGEETNIYGTFTYNGRKGFSKQPVDYYMRPFLDTMEKEFGQNSFCVGPRIEFSVLYNYALNLVDTLTKYGQKYFGLFWGCSMTHNNINISPNEDVIALRTLQYLLNNHHLNNTILLFASDHGMRFGHIRDTYQGFLEERLPFLFIVVPQWFRTQYPLAIANLHRNSKKLTTMFDIHATLTDLLDMTIMTDSRITERSKKNEKRKERGMSLFLSLPDRTCEEAGIPNSWCACTQAEDVSVDSPNVLRSATVVVKRINDILSPYKKCYYLELKKVIRAQWVAKEPNSNNERFIIALETFPNDGKFETTVQYDPKLNKMMVDSFISRIDRYGNQSHCVDDAHLKLYCLCYT